MARMRRRRSHGRYERKIEHRQWFTTSGFSDGSHTWSAGANTDNVVKVAVDPLKGDDQTILRTRGLITPYFSAFEQQTNAVLGAIVLPNKTAQNAANAELPHPLVDADTTDWFVWHPITVPYDITNTGADEDDDELMAGTQVIVDSKAKRLMEASESVVWILGLEPQAAVTNKRIAFQYLLRTLVGY